MRYAVLADIHANLPALEAVITTLERQPVDGWICSGDLVGYGPMPNEVVAAVSALGATSVAGNHDLIAVGRLSLVRCSPLARTTLKWTQDSLDERCRALLERLPRRAATHGIVVAHGSLDDPEDYIREPTRALAELERLGRVDPEARILIVGHTHVPLAVSARRGVLLRRSPGTVRLEPGERVLLNPGSVGQSRDRLPRARFMILDVDRGEAEFRSIRYDTGAVRRALRRVDLPEGAYHDRPTASRPLAVAIVKRVPPRVRRVYRWLRRSLIR